MGWTELVGYIMEIVAVLLKQHAANAITREALDQAVSVLKLAPPPKQ